MKKRNERNDKIDEALNLLKGNKSKQPAIIVDSYNCAPGHYNYQGRIINEQELDLLEKKHEAIIIFTLKENGNGTKKTEN